MQHLPGQNLDPLLFRECHLSEVSMRYIASSDDASRDFNKRMLVFLEEGYLWGGSGGSRSAEGILAMASRLRDAQQEPLTRRTRRNILEAFSSVCTADAQCVPIDDVNERLNRIATTTMAVHGACNAAAADARRELNEGVSRPRPVPLPSPRPDLLASTPRPRIRFHAINGSWDVSHVGRNRVMSIVAVSGCNLFTPPDQTITPCRCAFMNTEIWPAASHAPRS
jgi:hypothetical protein